MNTRELVNYLQGLAENNNRAWFVMNKPSYDILRPEFIALVADVIAGTAKFDPKVRGQDAKKALFRINRDWSSDVCSSDLQTGRRCGAANIIRKRGACTQLPFCKP